MVRVLSFASPLSQRSSSGGAMQFVIEIGALCKHSTCCCCHGEAKRKGNSKSRIVGYFVPTQHVETEYVTSTLLISDGCKAPGWCRISSTVMHMSETAVETLSCSSCIPCTTGYVSTGPVALCRCLFIGFNSQLTRHESQLKADLDPICETQY